MTLTAVIWFFLIGLIAGWQAGQGMRGGGRRVLSEVVAGVIGALLGALRPPLGSEAIAENRSWVEGGLR